MMIIYEKLVITEFILIMVLALDSRKLKRKYCHCKLEKHINISQLMIQTLQNQKHENPGCF